MKKNNNPKLEAKKAAVLKKRNGKTFPAFTFLGALVLLSAVMIGYYITGERSSASDRPQSVSASNSAQITYPISMFDDGKAHLFEYKTDSLTIHYFILKSSDGVVRAAFDACDVCWPAGKGYYQDGEEMVCRNCGRRFASVMINEIQGGCNPAPLSRTLQNGQLVLQASDIVKGSIYFNFKGKA